MNFNQARIQDLSRGVGVGGVHFSQKEFHITFYFTCVIFFPPDFIGFYLFHRV